MYQYWLISCNKRNTVMQGVDLRNQACEDLLDFHSFCCELKLLKKIKFLIYKKQCICLWLGSVVGGKGPHSPYSPSQQDVEFGPTLWPCDLL